MMPDDIDFLKIYVLLSPFLLLLTLYLTIKAADWLERREARHRAAE